MNIIDEGQRNGFPILLLHGLGANAESWYFQIPVLVDAGYRVLAPDLPGFGKSRFDGKRWDFDCVAESLINLLRSKNIENIGLLGISMGGVIGLKLAAEYPEFVKMSILVNTFAALRPRGLNEFQYFARRGVRAFFLSPEAQAELIARRVFPGEDKSLYRVMLMNSIKLADARVYRKAMLALSRFDGRKLAGSITNPVLVISGQNDTTVPLYLQQRLIALLPNSGHVIIQNAGHALPIDQPQIFNQIMLRFYANPSEMVRLYSSKSTNGCLQAKF